MAYQRFHSRNYLLRSLFDVAVEHRAGRLACAGKHGRVRRRVFSPCLHPVGLGVREAVTTAAVLAPFLPLHEALLAAVAFRAWLVLFDGINAVLLIANESRRKC